LKTFKKKLPKPAKHLAVAARKKRTLSKEKNR
jgi:hypothetical protein